MKTDKEETIDQCHVCGATTYLSSAVCCDDSENGTELIHCESEMCAWRVCDNCEKGSHNIDDFSFTDDDKMLCASCRALAYIDCASCALAIRHDAHSYYEDQLGNYYCQDCYFNLYYYCQNCEEETLNSDYNNGFCPDCVRNQDVHDYGYKPEPIFHGHGNVFMGVELEVDELQNNTCNIELLVEELTEIYQNETLFYLKNDSTLRNGVEIVTHPATLQAHNKLMPWKEILTKVKENGFGSHNPGTCGLHVHVSRRGLGRTRNEQDATIDKLIVLFWKFEYEMWVFSRRKERNGGRWASWNHEITNDMLPFKPTKAKEALSFDRYRAINTTNVNTIEFRLFRGTLKLETLKATLQLVDTVVDLAHSYSLAYIVNKLKWEDIINYGKANKDLREYNKERGLPCA